MLSSFHNPDILTCLANLSSDEVFTPPDIANQMLDTLPQKIWSDETITFLDPGSKSGVFLREITKRLLEGLEDKFTNIEKRLEHILKNQVFGIGITKLTSEISRRTLYCSKRANSDYSIVKFVNEEGNLRFFETQHVWENGKCKYCGVRRELYQRDKELESYSYDFIHNFNVEEVFNMKFDVIVGNPPYHLKVDERQGGLMKPIYHLFIKQAMRLKPRYLSMVVPSRWFAGGVGLNEFREEMLSDKRLKIYVDYQNAKDCFPSISLGGGVGYFLWERDYEGKCEFINKSSKNKTISMKRYLDQHEILVRDNIGLKVVNKVININKESLSNILSTKDPFRIPTKERGKKQPFKDSIKFFHSQGYGYMDKSNVSNSIDLLNSYKLMVSETTSEHAGEPSKDGRFKVISTLKVLEPKEACTMSYLCFGPFDRIQHVENLKKYLETKFARFLILQATTSIHLTKGFIFVPKINLNKEIDDKELNKIYGLDNDEVKYIDSLIKDM